MKLTEEQINYIKRHKAEGMSRIGNGYFGSAYIYKDDETKVLKITTEDTISCMQEYKDKLDKVADSGVNVPRVYDYVEIKTDDPYNSTDSLAIIQDYIKGTCLRGYIEQGAVFLPALDQNVEIGSVIEMKLRENCDFEKHRILASLDVKYYKKLFEDMFSLIKSNIGVDLLKESNFIANDKGLWLIDTHTIDDKNKLYLTYDICKAISKSYVILVRAIDDEGFDDSLNHCDVYSQLDIDKYRLQSEVSRKFIQGLCIADIPSGFVKLGLDEIEQGMLYANIVKDGEIYNKLVTEGVIDQDNHLSQDYMDSHPPVTPNGDCQD